MEKKKRYPFDDIFDFDEEFDKIHNRMERIFNEMFKENLPEKFSDSEDVQPFVYGFSMRVGSDGKPSIQEFGNTQVGKIRKLGEESERPLELEEREPLTDIIEGENEIYITVEIPGVEKEDINLNVMDNTLTIDVDVEKRKYHKKIKLSSEVDPNSTVATYKNGVLDITLKRRGKKKEAGTRINIK
jgi:HSP20 family protein